MRGRLGAYERRNGIVDVITFDDFIQMISLERVSKVLWPLSISLLGFRGVVDALEHEKANMAR